MATNAAPSKELVGKLNLKVSQFDDSAAQEQRFIDFAKTFDVNNNNLYRGPEE